MNNVQKLEKFSFISFICKLHQSDFNFLTDFIIFK